MEPLVDALAVPTTANYSIITRDLHLTSTNSIDDDNDTSPTTETVSNATPDADPALVCTQPHPTQVVAPKKERRTKRRKKPGQEMTVLRQPHGPRRNVFNGIYKGGGDFNETMEDNGEEVIQCQKLRIHINKHTHPFKAAKEMARCLHEYKQDLIVNVVKHLGVETAFDLFLKTKAIQEKGGELTMEGTRKKNPGGVFLSLVKKTASKEQLQEIFRDEKQRSAYRKRRAKCKRGQEMKVEKTRHEQCLDTATPNGINGVSEGDGVCSSPVEDMEVDPTETQCNGHCDSTDIHDKLLEFEQMALADVNFGIEFDS